MTEYVKVAVVGSESGEDEIELYNLFRLERIEEYLTVEVRKVDSYYFRTLIGGRRRRKWLKGIKRSGNCSAMSSIETRLSLTSVS